MKSIHFIILALVIYIAILPTYEQETFIQKPENKNMRIVVMLTNYSVTSDIIVEIKKKIHEAFSDVLTVYVPAIPLGIKESSYLLEIAAENYPEGTYFIGIVEPDKNNSRIVFETPGKKKFLVPNNGIASRVIHYMRPTKFYKVDDYRLLNGHSPSTLPTEKFYTRAILALLANDSLSKFGNPLTDPQTYEIQEPIKHDNTVSGEILFSDILGNCITNLPDSLLTDFNEGDLLRVSTDTDSFFVSMGKSYASVPEGHNVCFINSSKRLEIAVNSGNFAERYALDPGSRFSITHGTARIGIVQYDGSEISRAIIQGMKLRLLELGFTELVNTIFFEQSATGNHTSLSNLVKKVINAEVDILLPSSANLQIALNETPKNISIIPRDVMELTNEGRLSYPYHISTTSDSLNYTEISKRTGDLVAGVLRGITTGEEINASF